MANEVSVIETVLTAKTDQHDKAIAASEKKLNDFGKDASDAGFQSWTKKISGSLKDFGTQLTTSLTVPLTALGYSVIKFGSGFESAFAGVRKTVAATEPELAAMRQGFLDMAKVIPITANELAKIGEAAGALGVKKEDIMGFTRVMADLGVTTNLTSDEAANGLARVANIMKNEAGPQFDRLGSTLVALGNAGASTEAEILAMTLRLAGAGKQAGLTEADIMSFANALSSVGIEAEAGGSAFSRVMTNMADATKMGGKELQIFAQTAGMSASEFKKAFQDDAAGAIISFVEGLGRITAAGKSVTPVLDDLHLADLRVRDSLARAAGAGDLFRESLETGRTAWKENIALTKEAAERYKTFESQVTLLGNQVKDVLIRAFDILRPTLVDIVKGAGDLVKGFGQLNPEAVKIAVAIAAVAAAIGPAVYAAGLFVSAIGALLSPIGLVVAAVAALGVAFTTNFGGIRDTVSKWIADGKRYYETHKEDIDALGRKAKEVFETYIKDLGDVAANVVRLIDSMKSTIDGFSSSNDGSWKAIAAAAKLGLFLIETALRGCISMFQGAVVVIKAFWTPIEKIIIEPIQKALNWLRSIPKAFEDAGKAIGGGLVRGHDSEVFKSPHFLVHKTLTALGELDAKVEEPSTKAGRKMAAAIKKAFKEEMGNINEWLGDFGGGLKLDEAIAKLIGPRTIEGMREFSKAADESKNKIQAWGITLQTAFSKAGDHLRVFLEDGKIKIRETSIAIVSAANELNQKFVLSNERLTDAMNRTGMDIIKIQAGVAKAVSEIKVVNPLQALADAKLVEATKRTGFDIINIQTETDDKIKEEVKKTQGVLKESWEDGQDKIKEIIKDSQEEVRRIFGDGLGNIILKVGNLLKINVQDTAKWAGNIGEVIRTLPGKWGDVTRSIVSSLNQWVEFGNSILKIFHSMNDSIPSSIGGIISSIIGFFKGDKAKTGVADAVGGLVTGATQAASGAATAAGQAAGGAVTGGISGGISAGIPTVTNAMTGIFSAITGAVSVFAQTFQSDSKAVRFAGGFLVGGPIGGILSAIFGGPSEFEKEKRKLTLDKMRADIASVYEDIKSTMVDTMQKGIQLLESIADSSVIDLPRKAIKRFVQKLALVLELWIDETAKFKGEALAKAKEVSDNLGGSIEVMLGGAELINAVNKVADISDEKIQQFVATTIMIIEKWLEGVQEIELQSAKFANKVSTRLQSSVELIRQFPELINSIVDAAKITITDAEIDAPFQTARRIIDRYFVLAEEFQGYALKKTSKAAEQFKIIFDAGKSMFEFFKLWSEYKPVDATIFDSINTDFDRVKSWFLDAITRVDEWLGLEETLEDKIAVLGERMSGIGAALTGAFGGVGGQNLTLQPAIASSAISALPSGGFSAAASGGGGGETHIHFHGPVLTRSQFQDEVRRALNEANRRGA